MSPLSCLCSGSTFVGHLAFRDLSATLRQEKWEEKMDKKPTFQFIVKNGILQVCFMCPDLLRLLDLPDS